MINKIIDGICLAINGEFGDEHNIYTDSVKQGLMDGDFTVKCINPTSEQFLGNKYFKTNQFCIHYFPCTDEPRIEMHSVIERLTEVLEYITVDGDFCRGTNMNSEIEDDVLSFFVNYNMFVCKVKEETFMEDINHNTTEKG